MQTLTFKHNKNIISLIHYYYVCPSTLLALISVFVLKDTVDILIGWHIDATQQQGVIEFTSSTLIGFQQFWISDIHFTVTLLGQFLEDMESYAEVRNVQIACFSTQKFSVFFRLNATWFPQQFLRTIKFQ